MRILWLSHLIPYPPKGGVQQRSYNLMRELSRYHEVVLLAFNQRAHIKDKAAMAEAVEHLSQFCTILSVHKITADHSRLMRLYVAFRSLFGRNPYTVRWLTSKSYAKAVQSAVVELKPDAVHVDTISLAQYRHLFATIPAAMNHHNIESTMLLRRAHLESNPLKRFYFWHEGRRLQAYERATAAEYQAHLTCSSLDSERLREVAGSALVAIVVPNGVDLSYFVPEAKVAVVTASLIFAGRMSWYPNAAAMMFMVEKVWPLLKKRCPEATLTIVGKSPSVALTELAKKMNGITVTGFVDDVRPYLSSASVYVCPIRDGGGTKLKILDALAMGCAIVAHPIACEGIDVTDGVDVLLASTADEFVQQIVRLFDGPELRSRLSSAGRALAVNKYAFSEIGRALADCYELLRPQR